MKHRHLNHENFTLAAIDDILDRGRKQDWRPLIVAIRAHPYGEVAEKTLKLCGRQQYASRLFRCVIAAARQRA